MRICLKEVERGGKCFLRATEPRNPRKLADFAFFKTITVILLEMHLLLKEAKCHGQRWEKAGHGDNYTETGKNHDRAVIQQETFLLNYQT